MVRIAAPPPERPPCPIFHILPVGSAIVRIFDLTRYGTTALTFRHFGPLARFDHQRFSRFQEDSERGVYYCAPTFSSCLVEVFGDSGIIEVASQCVCRPQSIRELRLLDLRGSGAMKAGSVAALSKIAERSLSQAWSRYFYEHQEIYTAIDGIIYYNAHNDEEAIILYERAKDGLICSPEQVIPLGNFKLRSFIQKVALDNNVIFETSGG